ncbi:hypothetical protein RUM43_008506 [Polyplax serrata]|uniref:Uncharacterized protein n=1 Tax=Polyplax serrata TaxID=468196 RepID=A0AAN8PV30_POLSC
MTQIFKVTIHRVVANSKAKESREGRRSASEVEVDKFKINKQVNGNMDAHVENTGRETTCTINIDTHTGRAAHEARIRGEKMMRFFHGDKWQTLWLPNFDEK